MTQILLNSAVAILITSAFLTTAMAALRGWRPRPAEGTCQGEKPPLRPLIKR